MTFLLVLCGFIMSEDKLNILVSDSFYPLLDNQYRYLLLVGGKGSGKSEFAARKLLLRTWLEGNHKFLVIRKVRRTQYDSAIATWKAMLAEEGINYQYRVSKRITIAYTNSRGQPNEILFDGLDDPEKIESIKGLTGVHIEEMTELSENDFTVLDLCLREQISNYEQIIGSFNPDQAQAEWIKEIFFPGEVIRTGEGKIVNGEKSYIHHSTVGDNPIKKIRDAYKLRLNGLRDPVLRKIYREGQWAIPKGLIFSDWDIVELPSTRRSYYDDVWYGGDFGFSIDPTALVRIYRKSDHYWLEELIYELDMTNRDIANRMKKILKISYDEESIWDSSDGGKSITELRDYGVNAIAAEKGPNSVEPGIKFMKECIIHIVKGSSHIDKERKTYKYEEDRNGKIGRKPIKFNDHLLDASRYGIYTKRKHVAQVFV